MTRAGTGQVIGGVDTHKDVHVAVVIDSIGRIQGVESFPTTVHGYRRLLGRLQSHGELVAVGVEGCGSWGAGLARHLTARGGGSESTRSTVRTVRNAGCAASPIPSTPNPPLERCCRAKQP